jgi:hypothetical protein
MVLPDTNNESREEIPNPNAESNSNAQMTTGISHGVNLNEARRGFHVQSPHTAVAA